MENIAEFNGIFLYECSSLGQAQTALQWKQSKYMLSNWAKMEWILCCLASDYNDWLLLVPLHVCFQSDWHHKALFTFSQKSVFICLSLLICSLYGFVFRLLICLSVIHNDSQQFSPLFAWSCWLSMKQPIWNNLWELLYLLFTRRALEARSVRSLTERTLLHNLVSVCISPSVWQRAKWKDKNMCCEVQPCSFSSIGELGLD